MTDVASQQPSSWRSQTAATVAGIMRPSLTTVEPNDHVAAAAYLMKHAGATALVIVDAQTGQPVGIITETDITHAVADGKDLNEVRIHDLMTAGPVVIDATTSIRAAAQTMTEARLRHLPVVSESGLVGVVDITDVCRALLDPDLSRLPADPAGTRSGT
jgi:CBS domain-containing protein